MDADRLRALHRFGAVLSLALVAVGGVAFALGGPETVVLFCGFAGSLGGFYFVGAVLEDSQRFRVLGEELLRGVVWYPASLIAWSVLVTTSDLPATAVTGLWLPLATALGLSLSMVALRRVTGSDLRVRSESGRVLVAVGGVVAGFVVLSLVVADGRSPWVLALYAVGTVVGLGVWRLQSHRQRTA